MGWFDSSITDWIVALASVGVSGAAWKVAVDEIPKWRGQRNDEASDRVALQIVERALVFHQIAFQVISISDAEVLSHFKRLSEEEPKASPYCVNAEDMMDQLRDKYCSLAAALEVGNTIWSGDLKKVIVDLHVAQNGLIVEIVNNRLALQSTNFDEISEIRERIVAQPKAGIADSRTSSAFMAVHHAVEAIKPLAASHLFGCALQNQSTL